MGDRRGDPLILCLGQNPAEVALRTPVPRETPSVLAREWHDLECVPCNVRP